MREETADRYCSMPEIMKYPASAEIPPHDVLTQKNMHAHKAARKRKFKVSEIDERAHSGRTEE